MDDIQERINKFKDEFKEISHEELMKSEIYFEYFDDINDLCVKDLHVLERYLKDVLLYSNKEIDKTIICVSIINKNNSLTRFEEDMTIEKARKYNILYNIFLSDYKVKVL